MERVQCSESRPWQKTHTGHQTTPDITLIRHGTWSDRVKDDPLDVVMGGRFTRLFPHLPGARFDQADLKRLAHEMTARRNSPTRDRAGSRGEPWHTCGLHLSGQFADHDLTLTLLPACVSP